NWKFRSLAGRVAACSDVRDRKSERCASLHPHLTSPSRERDLFSPATTSSRTSSYVFSESSVPSVAIFFFLTPRVCVTFNTLPLERITRRRPGCADGSHTRILRAAHPARLSR